MKIRVLSPIVGDWLVKEAVAEANQFKAPDTEIDGVGLEKGPTSIESMYDEILASPCILERVIEAERDGCDGVFITCFGDPAVDGAREAVSIPVVGGFRPAVLMASAISGQWSVVTVLKEVVPLIRDLARKLGIESNIASIRDINTPVLELDDQAKLQSRILEQIDKAVVEDGAEAIVLGCTAMLGLGEALRKTISRENKLVPIVEPTAAAIGFLESMIRSGISHSKLTYPTPREKERVL
jgi:allantoin racemase